MLHHLTAQEQRQFFDAMLRDLVRKYLRYGPVSSASQKNGLENESNVGGVAAMVAGMAQNNTVLEDHIVEWLTSTSGEYASLGLDTRRAVIATLALRQGKSALPIVEGTDRLCRQATDHTREVHGELWGQAADPPQSHPSARL